MNVWTIFKEQNVDWPGGDHSGVTSGPHTKSIAVVAKSEFVSFLEDVVQFSQCIPTRKLAAEKIKELRGDNSKTGKVTNT